MSRFLRASRWVTAGLLAAGMYGQGGLRAQEGVPLPPIGSVKPLPRLVRAKVRTEPRPTLTELLLEPPMPGADGAAVPTKPPATLPLVDLPRVPDDGLGTALIPPASPPPGFANTLGIPATQLCGDGCGAGAKPNRFAKVPPTLPLPRTGWFPILPTGPGFYSLQDVLEDYERETPPKYPYPRVFAKPNSFFDIDWRYLDDPKNTETDHFDSFKRQRFGPDDCSMFTTGGEIRARYTHDVNQRLSNEIPRKFRGADNNYDLFRLRVFGDVYFTEYFRIFGEFISATSPDYFFTPLLTDRDPAGLQNLFVDINPFSLAETPVWFRLGRQELCYGSQRLLSPSDWANVRRTFQGAKAFWHSDKDDLDLFCVQPVIPDNERFNSVDNNVVFAGAWYTHRPKPGNAIDAYYLMLDVTNPLNTGRDKVKGGNTVHTFGSRWVGDKDNWLWDVEGVVQTGEFVNQGQFSKAFTMGGGYNFADCPTTPQVWLYYDYASGTPNPGQGHLNQTFQQLFPFGHYYLGWVDLIGRKNINDVSAYLTFWPAKWIFTQFQCHNFFLDSAKDALYNTAGLPTRIDPTGRAGNYVGTELDLILNFHLTNHSDILLAYGHVFAGQFLTQTATTPAGKKDPQALYIQFSTRW